MVEICRIRQLLVNLAYPDSAFIFFLSGPWLHRSFHLRYRSSHWNMLGWTRKFFNLPWKGCRWILQPPCLCTASWTSPKEWLKTHVSFRVVIPDISWGGLRLRKGGCSWYGRASVLSSSQRTYLIVLDSLQFQVLCFNLKVYQISLVFQVGADISVEI